MRFEGARGRELAEFVADHVFGHQHGYMQTAVMHGDGQSDHIGDDHGTPRPGLDRSAIILLARRLHLLGKVQIHEWAFLERTGHCYISRLTVVCSCGAARSCRRYAYCGASSCPWSAVPMGSRDSWLE